jgi:hypothetical protein
MLMPEEVQSSVLLPHLLALLSFVAIALAYNHPVLEGKEVDQHDIKQFKGMSREIGEHREQYHEEPLWTGTMFSGMPAYQISVLYPGNWAKKALELLDLGLPRPANYFFLLMAGMYFLGVVLGLEWWLALIGAFGFAFASYSGIVISAGHNSKVHAMAFMAPVVASVLLAYKGRVVLGSTLTALFLALQIATNHLQITYYMLLVIVLLGAAKLVKAVMQGNLHSFAKTTGALIIGAFIGISPNISALWTTADYGKETMRGGSELSSKKENSGLDKDYALAWSYGIGESFTMLIPDFNGGASSGALTEKSAVYEALRDNQVPSSQAKSIIKNMPMYWGPQSFTSGPVYLGAVICFLALLGLISAKGADRWWLLSAFVLGMMLSWGKHFLPLTDLFFQYVPGYNKFRAVSMTLVIPQLVLPILAVFGVKAVLSADDRATLRRNVLIAGGSIAALCLVFWMMPSLAGDFTTAADDQMKEGGYPEWLIDAIRTDRESLLQSDAMRSMVFVLLAAGLVFLGVMGKMKASFVGLALAVLTLADLVPVSMRYLNEDNFVSRSKNKNPFQMTDADKMIKSDPDPNFRVMNLTVSTFNDAGTSFFHKSIGGYHGAKLGRYQDLIDSCISQNNRAVINMLNTKYYILPGQDKRPMAMPNPAALGNAWFVQDYRIVANADEELNALKEGFEPERVAIIDKRFEPMLQGHVMRPDSSAAIAFKEYRANYLKYSCTAPTAQLAVFSEVYFANGWNAYVDGTLTPHFRADYLLRSMIIPAGEHTVEFKFEPEVYRTSEQASMGGSVLWLLAVAGGLFIGVKRERKEVS